MRTITSDDLQRIAENLSEKCLRAGIPAQIAISKKGMLISLLEKTSIINEGDDYKQALNKTQLISKTIYDYTATIQTKRNQ